VIGVHCEIEHAQAVTLLRLKKPLEPPTPVSGKLEKELLLVTPMGNMPDVAGYVMSVCSRHKAIFLRRHFRGQKHHFKGTICPF